MGYSQSVLTVFWECIESVLEVSRGWFRGGLGVYLVRSGSVLRVFLKVYRWSTGMYWSVLRVGWSYIKGLLKGSQRYIGGILEICWRYI